MSNECRQSKISAVIRQSATNDTLREKIFLFLSTQNLKNKFNAHVKKSNTIEIQSTVWRENEGKDFLLLFLHRQKRKEPKSKQGGTVFQHFFFNKENTTTVFQTKLRKKKSIERRYRTEGEPLKRRET